MKKKHGFIKKVIFSSFCWMTFISISFHHARFVCGSGSEDPAILGSDLPQYRFHLPYYGFFHIYHLCGKRFGDQMDSAQKEGQ